MAVGCSGFVIVALAAGWLLNLIAVNNDPNLLVGDGYNPSGMAVYSAFTAFLVYIAGIVLLYLEVLAR